MDVAERWLLLCAALHIPSAAIEINGQPIDHRPPGALLGDRTTLRIEAPTASLHFGPVAKSNISVARARFASVDEADCARLMVAWGPMITGRLFVPEYDDWQNAADPLLFKSAGKDIAELPMRSNGLPFPLDQMIVDTSHNPGRRILRNGFIEALGHRMWLGAEFFRRVPGADRAAILAAEWLRPVQQPDGVVEITASDAPFHDDSSAQLQERLRSLLFPMSAG